MDTARPHHLVDRLLGAGAQIPLPIEICPRYGGRGGSRRPPGRTPTAGLAAGRGPQCAAPATA
eukprot:277333-Lingulodinium_polyedra.AAC.1